MNSLHNLAMNTQRVLFAKSFSSKAEVLTEVQGLSRSPNKAFEITGLSSSRVSFQVLSIPLGHKIVETEGRFMSS